jgi:hypothetical protein
MERAFALFIAVDDAGYLTRGGDQQQPSDSTHAILEASLNPARVGARDSDDLVRKGLCFLLQGQDLGSRQDACYTRWPGHCWRQRHPGHAHRAFVWEEGRNPNAGHARTFDEAIIAASPECSHSGL